MTTTARVTTTARATTTAGVTAADQRTAADLRTTAGEVTAADGAIAAAGMHQTPLQYNDKNLQGSIWNLLVKRMQQVAIGHLSHLDYCATYRQRNLLDFFKYLRWSKSVKLLLLNGYGTFCGRLVITESVFRHQPQG